MRGKYGNWSIGEKGIPTRTTNTVVIHLAHFLPLSLRMGFLVFDIAFWWVCCVDDREQHIKMYSLNKKK